jgi:hypothetical protein
MDEMNANLNLKQELDSLTRKLNSLKQHDGDRCFVEYQIATLKEQLDKQTTKDIADLYGTPQVIGNTVVKVEPQPKQAPAPQPILQVVDRDELNRVKDEVEHAASLYKGNASKTLYFYNGKKLTSRPLYQFITKGFAPFGIKGIDALYKSGYAEMLDGLQTLEAYVDLLVYGGKKLDAITPEMITQKRQDIQTIEKIHQTRAQALAA